MQERFGRLLGLHRHRSPRGHRPLEGRTSNIVVGNRKAEERSRWTVATETALESAILACSELESQLMQTHKRALEVTQN
jgi:hypothetical protein